MIERLYVKNNLSFEECEIEFDKGLIVFTGASGSGKSILFDAMIAIFGFTNPQSEISEVVLNNETKVNDQFSEDLLVFKQIKKDKNRYLVNNQTVSREYVKNLSSQFIGFLGFKNSNFFEQEVLVQSFDDIILTVDNSYKKIIDDFNTSYELYSSLSLELNKIIENEKTNIHF